jgi:hypothetical protein
MAFAAAQTTWEIAMDFDQIGNSPNESEIELLYREALTAFAECTGLEAKRDDAIKKGVATTKRLYEIVGADNWEPLLNTKGIKRKGRAKGRFQPLVKHAVPHTSGWVSKVASVLDEAVENNIPAERICKWISQTPNGINGIHKLRTQRKQAEKRAAKGLPPLPTKEQKHLAYDELLSMDFVSEHELPEAWRDYRPTDPVICSELDAFEVALAARFENGRLKLRGYFVPGSDFWIGKAGELLRSRAVDPNRDSSLKKNPEEPCAHDQVTVTVENVPDRAIEMEARSQERRPTLIEQQHSPPPTQGLAVTTHADPSYTAIEKRPPGSTSAATEPRKIKVDAPPVCRALHEECIYATCKEKGQCLMRATRGHKAWAVRVQHQIWSAAKNGEIITPQEARRRSGARRRRIGRTVAVDGERQTIPETDISLYDATIDNARV